MIYFFGGEIFIPFGFAPSLDSLESVVLLGAFFLDSIDLVENEAHTSRKRRRFVRL
jgi:hypothetical protein